MQDDKLVGGRVAAPVLRHADDAAIGEHPGVIHVAGVDIAGHPVNELVLRIAREGVAIDVVVVLVIEVVGVVARIDVPDVGRHLDLLAPGLRLKIDGDEELAVLVGALRGVGGVVVPQDTDLIGLQAAEAAAVLAVVDLEQELAFGVQHIDVAVVGDVEIARRVDGEGRDVAAHAILLVRAIVGHGEVDIGDRAAVGGNVHEVGRAHVRRGVVILVHGVGIEVRGQVILCRIDVHEHPERAVVGACHVVAVDVALTVLGNRGQLQVGKLGARAGIGVDRQKDQLLGVIRPGVARVRVGLDDLVALHVGGQEDRRASGAHRVDVLDVLGQLQVEVVGLIGVFRRRGGGLGLVDERAAGVGLAARRIRVFRAARKQAHHKQSRQRERKKAFEFHAVLLFHSETICCTVI